ncbi:hypothetical protein GW17_00038935 [Ensete ventricosum]|uniref:Uncharacterized protein n=1 Tax=Ensete ventricosum TaxID=4639 RepID=A0A426Z6X8_ENSVE|nr:hypothetical protein B296_00045588 [Ensete ventricosum]RWV98230.1 hypothetical protein GW17_00038935 [Ensete ventricosum]
MPITDVMLCSRVGRKLEAKDAARGSLKSPWWTLGFKYQVALDEAAFLLDLASIDGNWDEVVDRVAECYMEAGLRDIAKFILYRE